MIVIDSHIWLWWIENPALMSSAQIQHVRANEPTGLGVSAISCWELAKKAYQGKLHLPKPIELWIGQALKYPGIQLLPLSPDIAIEANRLPPPFHKGPADQIIVATARIHKISLLTADAKILAYPHVSLLT